MAVDSQASGIIGQIAEAITKKQCILFLGAGVHAPPPEGSQFAYPDEHRPPSGTELTQALLAAAELLGSPYPEDAPTNLQRVALFYEVKQGRPQLVDEIAKGVRVGKEPSAALRALAELGFPRVITTNYDRLFERALAAAGKDPRVSVYTPKDDVPTVDYRDPTPESPVVSKIHGDIEQPDTLVVTDEDYIQFLLRMSDKDPYDPIPLRLKMHLTDWTTVFVGYSLLDYNLRLLFKALRWKVDRAMVPDMYAIDPYPDPLIVDVWCDQRRYVRFVAQDAWTFVPELYRSVLGREISD